jgi:hypothetical protein
MAACVEPTFAAMMAIAFGCFAPVDPRASRRALYDSGLWSVR